MSSGCDAKLYSTISSLSNFPLFPKNNDIYLIIVHYEVEYNLKLLLETWTFYKRKTKKLIILWSPLAAQNTYFKIQRWLSINIPA